MIRIPTKWHGKRVPVIGNWCLRESLGGSSDGSYKDLLQNDENDRPRVLR